MNKLENCIDYVRTLEVTEFDSEYKYAEAKRFILNLLMDMNPIDAESFIHNEIKDHFKLSKDDIRSLKKGYKEDKRTYDTQKAIDDLNIDDKYDGLYTPYMVSLYDKRVKINPHPDRIADFIMHDHYILTYKDTMFVYRDGYYRAEQETITDIVTRTLNDICKGDNSNNISRKISDVIAQIQTKTRVHEYPFNTYKNAFPVENGVLIFDFENKKCELVDHDPAVYKFNFKIPAKFDNEAGTENALNLLRSYVDNPIDLIEIPAQSFMQAMGHGPYKRGYAIQGVKNTGKSSFIEFLEKFIGADMRSDVSLEQINERFQVASVEGKLLNMHDDVGFFTMKNAGTFKELTGSKTHRVERKGKDSYDAILFAVHVFTMNLPAKYDDTIRVDEAFWERFSFIVFANKFEKDGDFQHRTHTPETMSQFLNLVIAEMLNIGNTGRLSHEIDWYETREKWTLAGNRLYAMVNDLMEPEYLNIDSKSSRGTAFIKEELLNTLQRWCFAQNMDIRTIPDSTTDLTKLVNACGWESDSRRIFKGIEYEKHCYVIPYKWKNTVEALKYSTKVTDVQQYQRVINIH